MSGRKRNDGRPRSFGLMRLDPLPYRNTAGVGRYGDRETAESVCGEDYEFDPRAGFIYNEDDYA